LAGGGREEDAIDAGRALRQKLIGTVVTHRLQWPQRADLNPHMLQYTGFNR